MGKRRKVKMMKLIVGLGNPGAEYEETRHNIGFEAIDSLARYLGVTFKDKAYRGRMAQALVEDEQVVLLKPETYMNCSADSVVPFMRDREIDKKDLLLIHDDIDLVFGKVKFVFDSRSAGQRGVQSIIDALGSQSFYRARIGVGREENKSATDFVLSKFSNDESKQIEGILNKVCVASRMWIVEGFEAARQGL
jgi:peptidyl-tRNA hydrolase, PTH1 family